MAQWYVSEPKWSALQKWSQKTWAVGDVVANTVNLTASNMCAHICITAGASGTSEPNWNTNNNGITNDGAAQFQNVTGQSATAWATPAGSFATITSGDSDQRRSQSGDYVFLDSTSHETNCDGYGLDGFNGTAPVIAMSVNASGAVPPGKADYQPGASLTFPSGFRADMNGNCAFLGVDMTFSGNIYCISTQNTARMLFRDLTINCGQSCVFQWSSNGTVDLRNVTINNINANGMSCIFSLFAGGSLTWINDIGVPAITGSNTLGLVMSPSNQATGPVYFEGLDFSEIASFGTTAIINNENSPFCAIQLNNCPVSAGVPILNTGGGNVGLHVEYINCDLGSQKNQSGFYSVSGILQTDTTNYLVGGSSNKGVNFSQHLSTGTAGQSFIYFGGQAESGYSLESFDVELEITAAGSPVTAVIQGVSDTAGLTAADIWVDWIFPGSATSCISGKAGSGAPLSTDPVSSGTGTWSSPPASPFYFSLQCTFTPEAVGIARGRVHLIRPLVNVWIDCKPTGIS